IAIEIGHGDGTRACGHIPHRSHLKSQACGGCTRRGRHHRCYRRGGSREWSRGGRCDAGARAPWAIETIDTGEVLEIPAEAKPAGRATSGSRAVVVAQAGGTLVVSVQTNLLGAATESAAGTVGGYGAG